MGEIKDGPVTADRLRKLLSYDPETGVFRWKETRGSIRSGARAGCDGGSQGRIIRVDKRLYSAARLAWLYMTGEWPPNEIYRNNGEVDDDCWCNFVVGRPDNLAASQTRSRGESILTVKRLREVLCYDTQTGLFTWLHTSKRVRAGDVAGSIHALGYVIITIDGWRYRAHRLAWLYAHGRWPDGDLDHRNTVRSDNRIENLRPANNSQNCANASLSKRNSSGFKGVWFDKQRDCWQAGIRKDRRLRFLGRFHSLEAAHAAYSKAAKELFGEYARTA